MRAVFLLGAGVSIPAGLPATDALTKMILRTGDYRLHSNECFVRAAVPVIEPYRSMWVTPLYGLLNYTHNHIQHVFCAQGITRPVNYEDLYFAISQVEDHLFGEFENPALDPFTRQLEADLTLDPAKEKAEALRDLAQIACRYIQDVMSIRLRPTEQPREDHLRCLVDAVQDQAISCCDVVTLNHDTLIERVLAAQKIEYHDGFGAPDGEIARWEPQGLFETERPKLLKLHGSLDWCYDGHKLTKVLIGDRDHAKSKDGTRLEFPSRPLCLTGTFNKMVDYCKDPFHTMHFLFRRLLQKCDLLVVSGFSFGDKGINTTLAQCFGENDRLRMLVLDTNRMCLSNARGAITTLSERHGKGRIFVHPEYIGTCSWSGLRDTYLN